MAPSPPTTAAPTAAAWWWNSMTAANANSNSPSPAHAWLRPRFENAEHPCPHRHDHEHKTMIRRMLGPTDFKISIIGFGAFAAGGWMWGDQDDEASLAAMN